MFASSGVDAPVREIAEKAGVGTLYRHFPQRSDLIKAIVQREVDACAGAASALSSEHDPAEALMFWMQRFVDRVMAKRGLSAALHSGDPAYGSLPSYFLGRLAPALQSLLDAAAAVGAVRGDVEAGDLLLAAARLANDGDAAQARRMIALLVDGLRFGARAPFSPPPRKTPSGRRGP